MTEKELQILNLQPFPFQELENLMCLRKLDSECNGFSLVSAYLYGIIQGKRQERARRKRK